MADASGLYQNLPDCYSKDPQQGLYKLLSGLAVGLSGGQSAIDQICDGLGAATGSEGLLTMAGENLAVARPPGVRDANYAVMIPIVSACKRGTIQAIRSVFEAISGATEVTVEDRQLNGSIPIFEIWIWVKIWSHGRGAYAEFDTQYPSPPLSVGWPVESCIAGDEVLPGGLAFNGTGLYGGEYNDHWWDYADHWTQELLNKIKLAGTVIVYQLKFP